MKNIRFIFAVSCVAICLLILTGCSVANLQSRAYVLGGNAETQKVLIDQIVRRETKRHYKAIMRATQNKTITVMDPVEEDGVLVVQTTPEGHREIKAALKELEIMTK